jgi:TonB-linked SusC/RagA family outer membrane protein
MKLPTLLWLAGLLLTGPLLAQTVTGTITDTNGQPLIGASVLETASGNGTVTDLDGRFSLEVTDPRGELRISYTGYGTRSLELNGRTEVTVELEDDSALLDEVVVVGYATQKKENLTGSVSSIRFDDVVTQPVTNPAQLLYGRVAGVQLEQPSGEPGAAPNITIRGPNINNSSPLIVVDGIQVNSFNEISPSDIETFTVLKDAASASIYGAQGANGVILITTKSGKSGKLRLTYNGSYGSQRPTDLPEVLMEADYARAMNEREQYGGGGTVLYEDDIIRAIENGTADPNYFGGGDWFETAFQPAPVTDHYLSASGGAANARYLLSARYNNQQGTLFGDNQLQTYNVRAKLDIDATDWLTIGVNMVGNYLDNDRPTRDVAGGGGTFRNLIQRNPLVPIYYTNGDFSGAESFDGETIDPAGNDLFVNTIGENFVDRFTLYTQLFARVDLLPGLSYEPAFVHNFGSSFARTFSPTYQLYDGPDREVLTARAVESSAFQDAGYGNNYQWDNIVRYQLPGAGRHYIGGLLGHQLIVDNNFNNAYRVSVRNFASNDLRGLSNGNASTLTAVGQAPTERILQSFFGRLEYRFDERYLLELNARFDGGSQFPPGNRYGFFPAVSGAWRISQEAFFEPIAETVTNLKIRGSWGRLGSLNSLSLYPYQQTFSVGADYIFGEDDSELTNGVATTELANSNLKWEETTTINIGLDVELWTKFNLTVDAYRRNTDDIILRLPIPITAGAVRAPFVNAGNVRNEGIEVALGYRDRRPSGLTYGINLNLTTNRNEVLSLPGVEGGEIIQGNTILREGESLYSYYGLVFDGIYQNQEAIDAGPTPADGGTQPGYRRYLDLAGNEDGGPDGRVTFNDDRAILGNSFPRLIYGLNGNLAFRGVDLSFIVSGVSGVDRLRPQNGNDPLQGNMLSVWQDRWSPTNPSNAYPVIGSDRLFSSWDVIDGSYLRMKLAEIGYTLPPAAADALGMDRLRFYVSGTNLFTITDFTPGFDPETAAGDRRSEQYPQNQTYVFGVNVTF